MLRSEKFISISTDHLLTMVADHIELFYITFEKRFIAVGADIFFEI